VVLTTHLHLAPRLKKENSYNYLPLWSFEACYRVNFTLLHYVVFSTALTSSLLGPNILLLSTLLSSTLSHYRPSM